jgi:hypothetical protein
MGAVVNNFSKSIRQELGDFLDSCRLEGELWMFPPIGYLLLLTTLLAVDKTKLSPATTYLKWLLPVPFATLTVLQNKPVQKIQKAVSTNRKRRATARQKWMRELCLFSWATIRPRNPNMHGTSTRLQSRTMSRLL